MRARNEPSHRVVDPPHYDRLWRTPATPAVSAVDPLVAFGRQLADYAARGLGS